VKEVLDASGGGKVVGPIVGANASLEQCPILPPLP
jgi:hypothetical protein